MFPGFLLGSLQARFFNTWRISRLHAHQEKRSSKLLCKEGGGLSATQDFQQQLVSSELSEMEKDLKITSIPFVYVFICIMPIWMLVCIYVQTYKMYMCT